MNAVVERLTRDLDAMCRETRDGVREQRPGLLQALPTELVDGAIRATHERAIELIAGTGGEPAHQAAEATEFGRRAARFGVGPEDVMAGYRVGAEIANARVRAVLLELAAPTATVLAFWAFSTGFFDELADRTVDGVQREATAQHGRRTRARQILADALLVGEMPVDDPVAAWPLPGRVVVVVARSSELDPPEAQGIVARRDGRLLALCAADAAWLEHPGVPIAVGPAVVPADAARSWSAARTLAAHFAEGQPLIVRAGDHLIDLVLAGDPWAATALPGRMLEPLDAAPARSRALLEDTLRAWLDHPGRPRAIADALHLHPQTVQYRLRRLRAAFGDGLDDPEHRLSLQLALRLRATAGARAGRPSA